MEQINHIYVILPILSFITTISLSVIAILKRKNNNVNIWFSICALWWALIPLIFIIHHLTDDIELLIRAEQTVEFFFVYGVPLQIVLFHRLCNIKKIKLEIVLTFISFLFSLTAFSEYCIIGMRKYSWGYIAYGGPTFNLFALYALIGIIYGIVFIYRQYKIQNNEIIRTRIKYILSSYIVMNILTLLNMPAINGINIYPPGNFCFIPLTVIAYSLLRYKLLDLNQFLLQAVIWLISIFTIVVPIVIISYFVIEYSGSINFLTLSIVLSLFFSILLLYYRFLLPVINKKIQKQSHDFRKTIDDFNSKIVQIKSVRELTDLIFSLIKSKVSAGSISLLLKDFNKNKYRIYLGTDLADSSDISIDFNYTPDLPELLEKDQIEVSPLFQDERESYLKLFKQVDSEIIIPLLFNNIFIGSINIGKKIEGRYKRMEVRFLERMVNSINIAFSNSLLLGQIEELNFSLEKKVDERTAQLQEANQKLHELDRLKSNFFANISHELRTPLTLLLSPVESVLQGDYGEKVERIFFENLHRNGIRLLKLINNLLDFSKIEAGRMNMKIHEMDIIAFLKNYVISIHSAAESKGIEMRFASLHDSVSLFIDQEKMDKIIMNLFSNSLKFTEKGGFIKINITDDAKYCYIVFEDSGVGIPSDKIDLVFDRFSQVDSGSTRKYEGTGIGLSLVKEFVVLHGGEVSVTSRFIDDFPASHGTCFVMTIPKGKDHFADNENIYFVKSSELEASASDHRFFGMREMAEFKEGSDNIDAPEQKKAESGNTILVVEDNPDLRNFLKFLLSEHYNVHLAVNGGDGLNKARELKPDLIISDVMMPVMNGYEMTKKIKEDKDLKRIPVIMLTAKAELAEKIEGLENGADDYLTKPFSSKELFARIKILLKTRNYEIILEKRNSEIEEELKIARLLQHKLLPHHIPEITGYRFHPIYIPMDKVCGDFYDFSDHGGHIEIFISDVSGHGLVAAYISLIAKMALDSISEKTSCSHVMHLLNEVICKCTVNSNYITAFFCIVEKDTNIMKYSNAGHMPPLVYRKNNNDFYELKAKGKPLGWFADLQLSEEQIQLEKGDRVLLYTDGITECMNGSRELFGEKRFKDFIISNIDLEPEAFSDKLINDLKIFSGNDKFDDDLCLIVFDVY
jgi:signal transduction histidine kinase/serine phosphatase RsbU (regulator of sigma subunit)